MIIAVDFDGVLCEDKFPEIGKPNYNVISSIRQMIDGGHEVILWTCRADNKLTEAVEWCHERGLHFCAVNENAPSNIEKYRHMFPNGTRKVYADVYVDDHNIESVLAAKELLDSYCVTMKELLDSYCVTMLVGTPNKEEE